MGVHSKKIAAVLVSGRNRKQVEPRLSFEETTVYVNDISLHQNG